MDLKELMERLQWYYDQKGGAIEIFVGGETQRASEVNFDSEKNRIII